MGMDFPLACPKIEDPYQTLMLWLPWLIFVSGFSQLHSQFLHCTDNVDKVGSIGY